MSHYYKILHGQTYIKLLSVSYTYKEKVLFSYTKYLDIFHIFYEISPKFELKLRIKILCL